MLTIADAADAVGVPPHRLRHYEASALLAPERAASGYRLYSPDDIARARQVKALIEAGFSTSDIALMLPCMEPVIDEELRCCAVTRSRLAIRLAQVAERRKQLERTERALAAWLDLDDAEPAAIDVPSVVS